MKLMTLERLLILGLLLAVLGAFGIFQSFEYWQQSNFGNLDYETTMRQIVPSAVILVVGIQTVFGSFLADIIGLGVQRN